MAGRAGKGSWWRRVAGVACATVLTGAAFGLTTLASCGSTTIAPSNVYVTSTIGPSTQGTCNIAEITPQLVIGTSAANGGVTDEGGTAITCSVTPSGSGFAVNVVVTGGGGGFSINGKFPSSGTATGVSASLTYGTDVAAPQTYTDPNCSVTLANSMTMGFGSGAPIAGGRAWATVTCSDMTIGGQNSVCQGVLTFRVENCVGSAPTSS